MTREEEEQYLFDKIVALKHLYEEVDNLVKSGYDGPFIGEEIRPLMEAYFKAKWGNKYEQVSEDIRPLSLPQSIDGEVARNDCVGGSETITET
jgi:hypothetical protein